MSRTGTLGRLFGHQAEPTIDLHAQDMARLGLKDGDLVQLESRRGNLVLPASASDTVAPTQAHVAMHWGDEVLGGQAVDGSASAGINALTNPAFCPQSRQPELKHTAVRLRKAALPWPLVAAAWLAEADALVLRQRLVPVMRGFGYASCVPFGHAGHGVLLRLAATEPPPPEAVAEIETLFGLGSGQPQVLRYEDRRRGQRRAIGLQRAGGDVQLSGFVLAGDTGAEGWIKALLLQQLPAQAFGSQLLSPNARAPQALASAGRQVCTCFNVGQAAIVEALAGCEGPLTQRLTMLQDRLKCGTNCGSCLPELRRLAQAGVAAAPPVVAV